MEERTKETRTEGRVLQVQSYSINDGDGVRSTIFLAGCPLRCVWCANPESQTAARKLLYYENKCVRCGRCVEACPEHVDPRTWPDCSMCGKCTEACLVEALDIAGKIWTADEVLKEARRDSLFFMFSGGGVTFSGGEPFAQPAFLRELADRFQDLGIDMWAETCGCFHWEECADIVKMLSHVFFDLKLMDPEAHKKYTGAGNEEILANATRIYDAGIPITIRIPAIPDVNLTKENIEETARFMAEHLPDADIELLPYHELGKAKYTALGRPFTSFRIPETEELEDAYKIFAAHGIRRRTDKLSE